MTWMRQPSWQGITLFSVRMEFWRSTGVFEMPFVPIAWTVCNSSNYLSKSASQPFCEDPFISQFAFPNNKHVPAQCSELRRFLGVSGDVLSKLVLPEAHSGAWRTGAMARINVDARTTVDQDNAVIRR